jgi:hypothetical protein
VPSEPHNKKVKEKGIQGIARRLFREQDLSLEENSLDVSFGKASKGFREIENRS